MLSGIDDYKVIEAFRFYSQETEEFDITEQAFMDEYRRWKHHFNDVAREILPKNASDAFATCSKSAPWFPHIHKLLQVSSSAAPQFACL